MRLPFKKVNRFFAQLRPTRIRVRKRYRAVFGVDPNLSNPSTFNEKLQWRKLHDRNPLMITCADKFGVRGWVKDTVGEEFLIPLLATVDNADEIPWDTLPEAFVIKAAHGSGWNHIVFNKNDCDREKIVKDCRLWLETNYYYSLREWHYKDIKPRLVIEELLLTKAGVVPEDYKFHCFRSKGELKTLIQVDVARFQKHRRCFYDVDWQKLPFTVGFQLYEGDVPEPAQLKEMLELATKLSEPFGYVRVDLYNLDGRIYFAELTFNHGSGLERFTPPEWDEKFGSYWPLQD
ncbi:MAG: ATP-grasp fold amidoligase family protein [Verrucomicrobiales bacterium]